MNLDLETILFTDNVKWNDEIQTIRVWLFIVFKWLLCTYFKQCFKYGIFFIFVI